MNKNHPQDRRHTRGRKQSNDPKWGSLPLPGQLSFDFWYEAVDERKPAPSAESADPRSQETSGKVTA